MNGEVVESSNRELNKKTIRNDVWHDMQTNNLVVNPEYTPYRVPRLVNAEETAILFKDLPEFKNATNILVNPDKAQDALRMACLQSGKTLFVQPPRLRKYLMTKVNKAEGASDEEFQTALTVKGLEEQGTHIGLEDNVSLDLVVVGSVAVSSEGYRIGQGHNVVDLSLALLKQLNFLKPETLIVTTVHDSQVLDISPDIMEKYDFPIDIIITPTKVIRTPRTLQRPDGVMWNLISERRLKTMPLLSTFRQKETEAGKECTLKELESEAESDDERAYRRPNRFFRGRINRNRRPHQNGLTQSETEQHDGNGNGEKPPMRRRRMFYRRNYNNYRRNIPQNDGAITKHSFRNKAWQLLQKNHVVTTPRSPYNRIPGYKGVEDAVQLLRQHDMYKNANSILVNMDKTHDALRLACLEDGKKMYVLMARLWKMLVLRVDVPEGENKPELKYVATRQGMEEYGHRMDMSEPFTVDLVVVGSVAVSKEGYRIGKGNGHADLTYAILREMNSITAETPIITAVHDYQVFETFPSDLFSEQDIPVDVIVTGSKLHTIEPGPRPRPTAIMWNLIYERQLKMMPILSQYREKLIEQGQTCELRKEDPNQRQRSRNNYLSESEHNDAAECESGDRQRGNYRPKRYIRHYRSNSGRGDVDNGAESGNMSPDTTTNKRRKQQARKNKLPIDFSIKLTNIQRNMRMRDLKSALQERSVKPVHITWKGYRGFCYLHFTKPLEIEAESPKTGPDSILESLANLTLYASEESKINADNNSPPNKIIVQLAKPLTRIEPVEQTAV